MQKCQAETLPRKGGAVFATIGRLGRMSTIAPTHLSPSQQGSRRYVECGPWSRVIVGSRFPMYTTNSVFVVDAWIFARVRSPLITHYSSGQCRHGCRTILDDHIRRQSHGTIAAPNTRRVVSQRSARVMSLRASTFERLTVHNCREGYFELLISSWSMLNRRHRSIFRGVASKVQ
jgi:hypothetical protein